VLDPLIEMEGLTVRNAGAFGDITVVCSGVLPVGAATCWAKAGGLSTSLRTPSRPHSHLAAAPRPRPTPTCWTR